MATKSEVYQLMKSEKIEVPDTFENFIEKIEEAVKRSGEGLKLFGSEMKSDCFHPMGQRIEKLNLYLNYLQVGEGIHRKVLSAALGSEFEDYKNVWRYRKNPRGSKSDGYYKELFSG